MEPIELEMKNYRCFGDYPEKFTISEGVTALVGTNNCGKSSLLRIFYEFRNLFSKGVFDLEGASGTSRHAVNIPGIEDNSEIFHNRNTRPLVLSLKTSAAPEDSGLDPFNEMKLSFTHTEELRPTMELEPDSELLPDLINFNKSESPGSLLRRLQDLAGSVYCPAFRNAINQGSGKLYDLPVGTSFVSQWDHWKNGPHKQDNYRCAKVIKMVRNLLDYKSLDINASSDQKELQLIINDRPYRLREMGSGIAQLIQVLAVVGVRRPPFVFIDEPELSLHPTLQVKFLMALDELAINGVIFATHSIGLARSTADRIYSMRMYDGVAQIRPYEETPSLAAFAGEMGINAYRDIGYDSLLLVEGPTEVGVFMHILRELGADTRVVVMPLGGGSLINGKRELQLMELQRLCPNIAALVDSELPSEDAELQRDRSDFIKTCEKLGIQAHLTIRRATENYFSPEAVAAEFDGRFEALEPFEEFKGKWRKALNGRIARRMQAREFDDIYEFLNKWLTSPA